MTVSQVDHPHEKRAAMDPQGVGAEEAGAGEAAQTGAEVAPARDPPQDEGPCGGGAGDRSMRAQGS